MSGACLYWWGWSQKCQYLPNFGLGLQSVPWWRLLDLQNILRKLRGDLAGTVPNVVVSTCDATLHSKRAYETIWLHNTVAIQHSYNTLSHNNQKDLKLNLNRASGEQPIRNSYLLRVTTELIENNEGLADGKVHRVSRRSMKALITSAEGWFLKQLS
jgi:hypothetical protein